MTPGSGGPDSEAPSFNRNVARKWEWSRSTVSRRANTANSCDHTNDPNGPDVCVNDSGDVGCDDCRSLREWPAAFVSPAVQMIQEESRVSQRGTPATQHRQNRNDKMMKHRIIKSSIRCTCGPLPSFCAASFCHSGSAEISAPGEETKRAYSYYSRFVSCCPAKILLGQSSLHRSA